MTTRTTHIAQTSREVKREYKKNGPRLPEQQLRQLERAAVLDERAARFRQQEERRRIAKKKREEKERKEREVRRHLGVGLATQLVGYSHTQAQLKNGMEAFLGFKTRQVEDTQKKEAEIKNKLERMLETMEKEPWDDIDADDMLLDDLPRTGALAGDTLIDEELDDDTLLEAHNLIISDAAEDILDQTPSPQQQPPPIPAVAAPQKSVASNEDTAFLRLHGPINKAIEKVLDHLPEPLIEMLSTDTPTNPPLWDPPLSLLHKLNPIGLPPHRLRIKVGCTVTLLRDLNFSSQLSKSSHLRILRVEKERLECLVLDGQLEGTKTFLTRVPLQSKYRNENNSPFQRVQFPIKVSTSFTSSEKTQHLCQSSIKIPGISGQSSRPTNGFRKPPIPRPKAKANTNRNPSFKLPGAPASKVTNQRLTLGVDSKIAPACLDVWDEFLDSGTQIARELSSDDSSRKCKLLSNPTVDVCLSTQDLNFTEEELNELEMAQPVRPVPRSESKLQKNTLALNRPNAFSKRISYQPNEDGAKLSSSSRLNNTQQSDLNRNAPLRPGPTVTPIKPFPETRKPAATQGTKIITESLSSFSEFGLSTQEAISFFDDDDFSSPTFAV